MLALKLLKGNEEAVTQEHLAPSTMEAVNVVVPKPRRDPLNVTSYSLLLLLNLDYKVLDLQQEDDEDDDLFGEDVIPPKSEDSNKNPLVEEMFSPQNIKHSRSQNGVVDPF
ncbi:hypothetical protein NDU88_005615 [Pleurodeles waltl]|uniref:Uncharacterized protein n=1 Tax=Pleurodeles waltl TaxID=8319 RepID=A0AAV7MWV8_PLEWA|nr:hypothetical protein NDU88_005615 [Pleurodeles waltl]